jgi:hypothetical protein
MLEKLRPRSAYDVMAAIACFGVLAGGTAYAADTIGSSDVINESLLSEDIKNGNVANADLALNSVGFDKIRPGNVFNSDLAPNAVTSSKIANSTITNLDLGSNSVGGGHVVNGSLEGADISESTLDKVPDADKLDGRNSTEFIHGGGRVLANRVVGTAQGTQILNVPYMGVLTIDGCDNVNGRIRFDTVGSGHVYFMVESGGSIVLKGSWSAWTGGTAPSGIYRMQMSRNTGSSTQIVDITVSWNAVDCVFAAQGLQTPAL